MKQYKNLVYLDMYNPFMKNSNGIFANNVLMQLYLFLVHFPSDKNVCLDSKQLVSGFLQDALSNRMSRCR